VLRVVQIVYGGLVIVYSVALVACKLAAVVMLECNVLIIPSFAVSSSLISQVLLMMILVLLDLLVEHALELVVSKR
jgi:hypothetical protein